MAELHARPRPVERAANQRDAGRIRASGRRRIARHRIENNGTAPVDRADRDGRRARAGARHVRRATARGAGPGARQHRRDADRRREDAGRRAGDLVVRARAARRPRDDRERLPGAPRRRVDGRHLPLPRALGGARAAGDDARRSGGPRIAPISRTRRRTRSASTSCATASRCGWTSRSTARSRPR